MPEHDYTVDKDELLSAAQVLENALSHIHELQSEISGLKQVSRFGLELRFGTDDDLIRFYTGFQTSQLLYEFIEFVKPSATKMTSWSQVQRCRLNSHQATAYQPTDFSSHLLILEDQIFLTLTRIHQGFYEKDLAVRFKTSISTVSRIIIMWANYLYFLLGSIPIWPSRTKVDDTVPACFKVEYPATRVILDCSELKVQSPSSMVLQSELYSQYKSHTTYKGFIGIAPNDAVTFVSSLYGGSISDKEITRVNGIIPLLDEHDSVMADKGFEIVDLQTPKKCTLNIPPFCTEPRAVLC